MSDRNEECLKLYNELVDANALRGNFSINTIKSLMYNAFKEAFTYQDGKIKDLESKLDSYMKMRDELIEMNTDKDKKLVEANEKAFNFEREAAAYFEIVQAKKEDQLNDTAKIINLAEKLVSSEKKLAVAKEALEFYGDEENWSPSPQFRPWNNYCIIKDDLEENKADHDRMNVCAGKRARAALKQLSEQE